MFSRNCLFFLLMSAISIGFISQIDGKICKTEKQCKKDKSCQCWCSVKCGFRNKNSTDKPVYIKDDPYGKHCYCKQADLDEIENCVGAGEKE